MRVAMLGMQITHTGAIKDVGCIAPDKGLHGNQLQILVT